MKLKYLFFLPVLLIGTLAIFTHSQADEEFETRDIIEVSTQIFTGQLAWLDQPATVHQKATIIGVHGTPGSASAWRAIKAELPIKQYYRFIALDRPGWGASLDSQGRIYPSLNDQVDILMSSINEVLSSTATSEPVILIAHSWGGPVVLALAEQHPEIFDGIVLIASPADPSVSRPRWYHQAARLWPVQWIIGGRMTRSNKEMLTLDDELISIQSRLGSIQGPVVIMQGGEDWLVEAGNAFYLQQQLSQADVRMEFDEKTDHFIPFKSPEQVAEAIEWVFQKAISD